MFFSDPYTTADMSFDKLAIFFQIPLLLSLNMNFMKKMFDRNDCKPASFGNQQDILHIFDS